MHANSLKSRMFYYLQTINKKRGARFLTILALLFYLFLISSSVQAQTSTPVVVGYRDFNFGTVIDSEPTGEKPESKLWWNDGYWWACMWNTAASSYKIYRYNPGNPPGWTNTGVSVDNRTESRADILWDGQKLYVVSHIFSGSSSGGPQPDPQNWSKCYRFSYSSGTYTLDPGFPTNVNISTSETLVLAKDSTGKLWVTWIENSKVKMVTSSDGGENWGSTFDLPNQGGKVNVDDISAVVAFGGSKIGVMWSNQQDDKIYFIVHNDSDNESTWQAREDAVVDAVLSPIADDHIHLKPASDGSGNLYATTKTGLTGTGNPLIFLLKRSPSGTWTRYELWETEHQTTRPIIMIDSTHQTLYAFARSLAPGPGTIYKKEVDLATMSIPSGLGDVFIQSDTDLDVNNPTSSKQWVTSETSLLVLCSDKTSNNYMHNYIDLRDATAPIISSFTPALGPVGTDVTIRGTSFTDATEVTFNGVPATTFTVVSDSIIHATVPNSATTGFISVTNMLGTGTSLDSFVVTTPPYQLTVFTIGPGTVTLNPPGGSYNSVTTVTLTAAPEPGYVFDGWSGDVSGSANPETIVMNDNKTVTATFIPEGGVGGGTITYRETVLGGLSALTTAATFDPVPAGNEDDLYLAAIASRLQVPVTSVTGLGLTWTLVETQCGARGQGKVEIWKAQGTPTGSDYVTVTFSAQPRNAVMAVTRYSGADPVNPIAAVISGNTLGLNGACSGGTDSDTYYFPVTTPVDNAVVYGVATMRSKRHYPGNGYEERAEYSEGTMGEDASIAVQDRTFPSAVTDSLHGRFSSAVDWAVIGLVLKPEGAVNAKTLAIAKTGSGSGSVISSPPGGIYEYLTEVELTAVPDPGSVFSGWGGDLTGTQNPHTILMDDHKMVTAEFTEMDALTVNTKIFLEGPYDVNIMKTRLGDSGLVPLSQPFDEAPWNYTGLEAVNSLPPGVVDWVLIGLRASSDATDLAARAAFVKNDGSVVDTNGVSPVSFTTVNAGNYYLVVYHRNHLPIMSSTALALDDASPLYDFTTAQSQAYSSGGDPMKELAANVYGLIAGDGNSDGRVNDVDKETVWRPQNATIWEYTKLGDFNLDGGIDVADMNIHWRSNFNSMTQVPGIIVTTAGRITTTRNEARPSTSRPARKHNEVRTKDQPAKIQRNEKHGSQQNSRKQQPNGTSRTSK